MNKDHQHNPILAAEQADMPFDGLVKLFEQTQTALQKQVAKTVDITLVVRNWLFGWYIVEFEQGGKERTELYGKKLIDALSIRLTELDIAGMSPTNLRKFREFYQCYEKIQQTLSVESFKANKKQQALSVISQISQTVSGMLPFQELDTQTIMPVLSEYFNLSWSHYVVLLTIKSADERRFYEIEAIESAWSIRELKRQISTSLYERLALSRDKEQVKRKRQ